MGKFRSQTRQQGGHEAPEPQQGAHRAQVLNSDLLVESPPAQLGNKEKVQWNPIALAAGLDV